MPLSKLHQYRFDGVGVPEVVDDRGQGVHEVLLLPAHRHVCKQRLDRRIALEQPCIEAFRNVSSIRGHFREARLQQLDLSIGKTVKVDLPLERVVTHIDLCQQRCTR